MNASERALRGCSDKEVKKMGRTAIRAGWSISVTSRNHLRWTSPDGTVLFSALTPSRSGYSKIIAKRLRDAGLDL